jgi:hypothetical protein
MSPRPKRETFANIVAEVKATPAVPKDVPIGPSRDGRSWGDLDGHEYTLVDAELEPDRAVDLLKHGALVVYDSCGCGGWCGSGLDWLDPADRTELMSADPPRVGFSKKAWGRLSEWRSPSGRVLIEAAVNVRWGDRIDG